MDIDMIAIGISALALIVSLITFFLFNQRRKRAEPGTSSYDARPLQLQAYERLVMLAERIALPSIISRANQSQPGFNSKEMQLLLLESIKQEYEYNATQQIYVSPQAWEAIKNLKDQNMLIINQVASTMMPDASGLELNRRLIEYAMTQKKGMMHEIVLEALNYEAKKLMK